jgi:hypothetical protein
MHPGYRSLAAATLVLILPVNPVLAKDVSARHRPAHHSTRADSPTGTYGEDFAQVLYSRRALRRARILLQLKLLELREERLACVRAALDRHLPADMLLGDARGTAHKISPGCMK